MSGGETGKDVCGGRGEEQSDLMIDFRGGVSSLAGQSAHPRRRGEPRATRFKFLPPAKAHVPRGHTPDTLFSRRCEHPFK